MKRLAIVGLKGRMGQEIASLAAEFGFQVAAGVQRDLPIAQLDGSQVDAVIDFSMPEITADVVAWCVAHQKPLVSGVTGLSDAQKALFTKASARIPVLWAPNMSLGVAVMARMFRELSSLKGFQFQLEELHHIRKKDKPSGTALFLQQKLEEVVGPQPAPVAMRGGGIFGIHKLWAMGEEETITIEHTAMNRRVFARGALAAAQWLLGQKSGLYRMDDVLGA